MNSSKEMVVETIGENGKCATRHVTIPNAAETWPKKYMCRFIEPGLVNYTDYGTVLVPKDCLDKMAASFIGKPVVNEIHKEVSPSDYDSGKADGIVTRVWFENDGWYWAEFLVWDRPTQLNCESDAYSVSCAYTVNDINSTGGVHNNIPFEAEIRVGEYTHLAIVANPRYEGARIIYNSKGGSMKFLKFWKNAKGNEAKNASEIDIEKAVVIIDGARVKVKELLAFHNAKKIENAEPLSEDMLMEIDGVETPLKDLVNAYREKQNADDKEKKEKEDAERKNAEEEEKKKKEEEERKNAEESEKKKKEEEMKNANGDQHFNELHKAASMRGEPQKPAIMTRREQAAAGAKKYGSVKAA